LIIAAADTSTVTSNAIVSGAIVAGFVITWFVVTRAGRRMVGRILRRIETSHPSDALERAQRIETLWAVARSVLLALLLTALALLLLDAWNISIAPLLAISSVVGIAVGFGAQDFIKDVIAGFLIVAEDQYSIGDSIRIAGVSGTVEAIRLRSTVLRDLEGYVHHVPNGSIGVSSNLTQDFSQVVIDLDVGYGENVDRVLQVVRAELDSFTADDEWKKAFLAVPEILGVQQLADWSVKIRLVMKVIPPSRWAARREFLRRIKNRFDAEGIEIPFPYINVVNPPGESDSTS